VNADDEWLGLFPRKRNESDKEERRIVFTYQVVKTPHILPQNTTYAAAVTFFFFFLGLGHWMARTCPPGTP
jgi:hypothetical protein